MKKISMLLCTVAVMLMGCSNDTNNGKGETKKEKGDEVTNEKSDPGTMKDQDGNEYKTVKIGSQVWMAENMRATHDRDGNAIALDNEKSCDTPYRFCPGGSSDNVKKFGYLYNWAAAMKVCPKGWHLPSDEEWKQLEMSVGMSRSEADDTEFRGDIAAKLCADWGDISTVSGAAGNRNASDRNVSGFSALPAGICFDRPDEYGEKAVFWTATDGSDNGVWARGLDHGNAGVGRGDDCDKTGFISVRCVRD